MLLSEIKRKCTRGQKLQLVHYSFHSSVPERIAGVREVTKVTSSAIKIGESWLDWPKADQIKGDEKGFTITIPPYRKNGTPLIMSYEYR